ncbi:MAG: hypothetical protein KF914_03645 [Rhizobiaceae bacterium]|nr:hypothetical protein [Rhizobiaceae bacterium]
MVAGQDPAGWSARGIATARSVLAAHGLDLKVGPGDLRVATRGGRQVRIRDLDGVWEAAEALLGHPLDPLAASTLSTVRRPAF